MTSAGPDGTRRTAPRVIARNASARIAGEILAKLASLAFFVTMARTLGVGGFGEFQFALALTGGLVYVAGFGTDSLLAREIARAPERAGQLLADAAAMKLVGGVAMLGVAAAIVQLGSYSAEARAVVYVVGVGSLLEVTSKSWHAVFQAHERLDLVSLTLILQRTATAAAGVAVLAAGGGVFAAGAVYAGGSLLAVVAAELWVRRLGVTRAALAPARWLPLARTAVPIGLITVLGALLLRVDVTMLSFLGDAAKVGLYAVGFRLVEATQFLGAALAAAMLPWFSRATGARTGELARGFALGLKATTALLLPIGLVFVLFAAPLLRLLYGSGFGAAVAPLELLGLVALAFGLNAFAGVVLIARDRPGSYARLLAPVLVLNVLLNLVLIPRYGPKGAAFDALLSTFTLAGVSLWYARSVVGRFDVVGALAGPAVAGAAMTAAVLVTHLHWPLEAAMGLALYAAVLAAFELLIRPNDARVVLRAVAAPLASRAQAGRTTA